MGTNREWMYKRLDGKHLNKEFIGKVENEFITFANQEKGFKKSNKMRCFYNKCWNMSYLDEDTMKLYLHSMHFSPIIFIGLTMGRLTQTYRLTMKGHQMQRQNLFKQC